MIKRLLKNLYLSLNDATIKTHFFFDGEYKRWLRHQEGLVRIGQEKPTRSLNMKICILVPGTASSGGIAVVFQHANRLQENGYDVKILSLSNRNDSDWFPNQKVEIVPYTQTRKLLRNGSMDILFATSYSTAFSVDMAVAKRKIYFVQSDESRFFPQDPVLCEKIKETYRLPIEYITEAKWIQEWLKKEFSQDVHYVPNGLDPGMFHQTEPIELKGKKPRILIEGSINVSFKGMSDAYSAIKDLDAEIWIVSNNGIPKSTWHHNRFFQSVPINKMKNIYSSCDIFLKMSRVEGFFGPPMEAMACGCAVVVGKVTGYDEYIIDGVNALVVESGDVDGAKKAVELLIKDKELRERLIQNGYQAIKGWTWEKSFEAMERVIKKQV